MSMTTIVNRHIIIMTIFDCLLLPSRRILKFLFSARQLITSTVNEKRTDLVFYEVKVSSYYHSAIERTYGIVNVCIPHAV